ncbi:MAG: tRNA (adenosine(37)-N6)-threonylcarbamoyltransferase complex dimerization subunit type 1 TsaB [bacterium]|nr:tRNA (adenosine(37)-N6)-threonylcarbamoyltransferase complex dimerization subunit type 1 TsaB [bacterium]
MRILGIDTSTKTGSVALIQGESLSGRECPSARGRPSGNMVVLAEYIHGVTQGYLPTTDTTQLPLPLCKRVREREGANDSAGWLLSAIDCMLRKDNDRLKIDGIAVVIGPGSFTGVRIGVSTAKGLGYALGVQIAGVISLDALAANIPSDYSGLVCPIMDAMRGEVYAAFYEHGKRISEYMLIKPEDLAEKAEKILEESNGCRQVTLLGDGVMLWQEFFARRLPGMVSFAPSHNSAVNVASIGMKMLLESKGKKPEEVVPLYLRASNAETQQGQGMPCPCL